MSDIQRSRDCGNSPKNQFAENIAISIELGDADFLGEVLAPDAEWELEDGSQLDAEASRSHLEASRQKPDSLVIDHVVTHGKSGAVNGTAEGAGRPTRRFCHVVEFSNTKCDKVRRLISYGGLQA